TGAGSNTQLLRQQAVTNAVLSGWQQAAVARIEDYGKEIGVELRRVEYERYSGTRIFHPGILQSAWNPCQLLFGTRRTAQLRWRAIVCIGPGSSRCQYGEQPLQMNKIEGPGGKSIFFPVFFLPFWLFYCIRKDQPLTTDLVWGLRILKSLLTAERLTSKYSVACSAHTGVGIDYLMFASFLQGWRISVGDSGFWGLRNKGYTNTQVYLDARGTLTKILGVALPPASLSGPQCGNGPRAELHPRLAEGCSKLK
ncbi:hypothetical protein OOU_Y34scaffold00599g1, partial [Pyricularia oryzae Y34]